MEGDRGSMVYALMGDEIGSSMGENGDIVVVWPGGQIRNWLRHDQRIGRLSRFSSGRLQHARRELIEAAEGRKIDEKTGEMDDFGGVEQRQM